jgi:hypothetical protein
MSEKLNSAIKHRASPINDNTMYYGKHKGRLDLHGNTRLQGTNL